MYICTYIFTRLHHYRIHHRYALAQIFDVVCVCVRVRACVCMCACVGACLHKHTHEYIEQNLLKMLGFRRVQLDSIGIQ